MAKIGFELEGRLRDQKVLTLFMSADEVLENSEHLVLKNLLGIFRQIYISDPKNRLDISENGTQYDSTVGALIKSFNLVTVCVTKLPVTPRRDLCVVLTLPSQDFKNVTGNGNEIKFDMPDGSVWVFPTSSGIFTPADDFKSDLEIEIL